MSNQVYLWGKYKGVIINSYRIGGSGAMKVQVMYTHPTKGAQTVWIDAGSQVKPVRNTYPKT